MLTGPIFSQWINPLEIATQYCSAQQLAKQLSSRVTTIDCDPCLSNRLFLVSFHRLELEKIFRLATKNLGLDFLKEPNGHLLMTVSKAEDLDDDAKRNALANYYNRQFADVAQACVSLVPEPSPMSIDAAQNEIAKAANGDRAHQMASKLFALVQAGDFSGPFLVEIEQGLDFSSLIDRDLMNAVNQADLEATVPPAWSKSVSLGVFLDRQISPLPLTVPEKQQLASTFLKRTWNTRRLFFDPLTGVLGERISMSFRPDVGSGAVGEVVLIPDLLAIEHPSLAELCRDQGRRELADRRSQSETLLAASEFAAQFSTPSRSRAVSEAVCLWSIQHPDRNVLMEVSPSRDGSAGRFLTGTSTQTSLKHELNAAKDSAERDLRASVVFGSRTLDGIELSQISARLGQEATYTVKMDDGVLSVRDEFGFIDHKFRFPGQAVCDFENAKFHNFLRYGEFVATLADLRDLCSGMGPVEDGVLSRFHSTHIPASLTASYAFFLSAAKAPRLWQAIQTKIGTPGQWSVSALDLPEFRFGEFCSNLADTCRLSDSVAGGGMAMAVFLHPQLERYVQESEIGFDVKGTGGIRTLDLSFQHAKGLILPTVTKTGELRYTPEDDNSVALLGWRGIELLVPPS